MIRFSWLQFRAQAAVAAGALLVIAVAFALTGPDLVHLYDTTVATCSAHGNCSAATLSFLSHDRLLQDFGNLVVALPALVGIFWGAPLVVLVYQPASRYWAFQWYEMAIFIGLAVVLGCLCFWWIRRRIS